MSQQSIKVHFEFKNVVLLLRDSGSYMSWHLCCIHEMIRIVISFRKKTGEFFFFMCRKFFFWGGHDLLINYF